MREPMETVRFLAETIGPRPPTSAAEAQAAAYVNARMREAGVEVEVQPFRAVATFSLPYGLLFLLGAASPLLYRFTRPGAFAISLLVLLGFVLETFSFPVVSSWLPSGKSQNVIGTRAPVREGRRHLIFVAHLDSSRAALPFHPRWVAGFRFSFLLTGFALVSLPALLGLQWALGTPWLGYVQGFSAGYLGLSFLLLVHRETLMPFVPGANDNASGVAVLLRLAEELTDLEQTALWFVATGCKESGAHGMRHFLRHYPFPKQEAFIVNLDHVGRGELRIITAEGMLWPHRADPLLLDLARQSSPKMAFRPFRAMVTDAQVSLVRGYRSISLMALEGGLPADWHWPTDTAVRIYPEVLERATQIAVGIARQVDALGTERLA
ncbi:MAG: M28 family metallopeptidase [Chloroflexia bacterium]